MAEQVFSKNFFQGIADFQKQIPSYNLSGDAQAALTGSVAWMRAIDYRTDPMAVTIMPASLKESGSTVTDLILWADTTPEALTVYAYGNQGWIYSRTAAGSYTQLYQVANSHGNGLQYFYGDDYLYYTSDSNFGRYGPIASATPQFSDNFLAAQGGIPTNTASLLLVAASSQYGHAASSTTLRITSDLTLETFFYANTLPTAGNSMTLMGKWDESGATRSYKLDIYGIPGFFGSGADGSLTIATNTTDSPINASISSTGGVGSYTVNATNSSFAAGQRILLHQSRGAGAGTWQSTTIVSYTTGTITTLDPLTFAFTSAAAPQAAQVQVQKQYTNVTINSGITYTASAWNGIVGGILSFFANGTLTVSGNIVADSCGFIGANGVSSGNSGLQGEGTNGAAGTTSTASNGNGGGGGSLNGSNISGGGGGGNSIAGQGSNFQFPAVQGSGGDAVGANDLTNMVFGGGGGTSSASMGGVSGNGGTGGGILFLQAPTITISGTLSSKGANGGNATGNADGSGAGAGGSILLKGQVATLGTNLITVNGGTGGTGVQPNPSYDGDGGPGYVVINYLTSYTGTVNAVYTGITSSILNSIQDNTLVTTVTPEARLGISNDGTSFEYLVQPLTGLVTATWNRISVSWTAAMSTAQFYLNGLSIGSATGTKTSIDSNAALFYVGANKGASTLVNYFDGLLNDMRIWANVQTATQILANNQIQINPASTGLAAYYYFNGNANDETSNANNLTLVNSPTYSSNVPFPAPTGRLDVDITQDLTGSTYTLPASIIEDSTDQLPFTPNNDPQAGIGFYVAMMGTGNWTVTIHDEQNKVIATQTIANANLPASGFVEFVFAPPWRIVIGKNYHAHLTDPTNSGAIVCGSSDNIATAEFTTYFSFLVTDSTYHPIEKMLNLLVIGNERYLATWDGAFYDPNTIAFPPNTHVRCFGFWREYLAIGTWKEKATGTPNITDWNEGRVYFWDGISQTFNFWIDVPEGQINALFGYDYNLYMVAGWIAQILVYQGGYIETVSTQATKVKKIPLQQRGDQTEIYPSGLTMYRSLLHIGVAGPSNSTTIQRGVYSWGTVNQLYPETLSMDYVISTGNYGNTVTIGMVYAQSSQLLISWQDGTAYGVDMVDFTNNPAADTGTIELLIQDGSDQKQNGIFKDKRLKQIMASYLPLTTGQSVSPKYKINRASNWTAFTDTTVGSVEKVFTTDPGLGREYQVAVDLFTTVTTSPTLLGLSGQYDDQAESKQFG